MKYQFTKRLTDHTCRICGNTFDRKWSSGGIGAVCQACAPIRDEIDLVEAGVVRNIREVVQPNSPNHITYTFEAKVDDVWYGCSHPCGNWSWVDGYPYQHSIGSVPVGWWELNDLYKKHPQVLTSRT